jgi:zinc protease
MKKLALLPACLFVLTACERAPQDTITLHEPESPFIAFNVWVKVGSQNDPAGKEGLAALTANLLSDGSTTEDSYDAILEKLYPMAAGYGYNVDKEMTIFTGRIHRDNLEAYYGLFRNHLLSPAFEDEDFERVKTQTMSYLERTRRYGRDEELSKELLFATAYEGTPYGHPEEGYVESVRSITLDDVKGFYDTYYVRNNIVVGVGGGYPDGFVKRVREDFNTLPAGVVETVPAPQPRMPDGIDVLIVAKPNDATPVSLGFPIPFVRGDRDYLPMVAMNSWFGEHRNAFSRLYQVIREARGMNYGDYSYIEAFPRGYATQQPRVNCSRRHHLFEVWIRPVAQTEAGNLNDRALFATRAALRELKSIVDEGMTEQTLAATQRFLRNYTINWGNTIGRRLAYAMDDAFYGIGGDGYLSSIRPALAALSLDRVNQAIQSNLQYDNLYIVYIVRDADALKRKLLSGEPTYITYAGERSAEHMAQDSVIASFLIPVREENITIIGINEVFERAPESAAAGASR